MFVPEYEYKSEEYFSFGEKLCAFAHPCKGCLQSVEQLRRGEYAGAYLLFCEYRKAFAKGFFRIRRLRKSGLEQGTDYCAGIVSESCY